MSVKVIVNTISSKRDVNGNTYHFARFYNPKKSRDFVTLEVGSRSNAEGLAYDYAGGWDTTICIESELPIREWRHCRPDDALYEGCDAAKTALDVLYA